MSEDRINKLFKEPNAAHGHAGDQQIELDHLPDLDILDHTDISFLMDYSLDGEEAVIHPEEPQFRLRDSEDNEARTEVDPGISSENLRTPIFSEDSELHDEFLGLFSKDELVKDTPSESKKSHYAFDEKQIFGDVFETSEDSAVDEEAASIGLEEPPIGIRQDYCSSFRRKRFLNFAFREGLRVGLDIGSHAIKYVVVQKSGKRTKLLAYGIKANSIRENSTEEEIVKYILNDLKFKVQFPGAHISWNIQGQNVGLKRVSLPQMKKKMLDEAILWTAKKDFGFEDAPAIIDYIDLTKDRASGGNQNELLVIGCAEEMVVQKAVTFFSEKFIPSKATPHANAMWKLYENSEDFDSKECSALIDLGAKNTTIAFFNQGVLEFSREIPTGGKDITDALTGTIFYDGKPYQLNRGQAEKLKLTYGFPDEQLEDISEIGVPVKEYSVLIRPIFERLGNEIRRSIDYYKENFSPQNLDHVTLLGGTSKLNNLIPYIRQFLDCDIKSLSPPSNLTHNLSKGDWSIFVDRFAELAIPFCLAADHDPELNLLPAFFKRLKKLKVLQRMSVYGVIAGFLFLAAFSAYSYYLSSNYRNQYNMMEFQYRQLEPLKKRYDQLKRQEALFSNRKNTYEKELILDNPLPDIMKSVSNLLPWGMSLRSLALEPGSMAAEPSKPGGRKKNRKQQKAPQNAEEELGKILLLSGIARSPRPEAGIRIADFMLSLNKSNLFESVKVTEQFFNEEDDELVFEIQVSLKE